MIVPKHIVAILLAAGGSRRFGPDDKLLAPLRGQPLVTHAANTLVQLAPAKLVAVCRDRRSEPATTLAALGFEIAPNPNAEQGLATSLSCGIAVATTASAKAVLVCLADMPFVTLDHLRRLLACFDPVVAPSVASRSGDRPMPPALFSRDLFGELRSGTGDSGARRLLREAMTVSASPAELKDIDRPEDLA